MSALTQAKLRLSQCCLQGLPLAAVKNCHQTEETSPRVRSQDMGALRVNTSKTARERERWNSLWSDVKSGSLTGIYFFSSCRCRVPPFSSELLFSALPFGPLPQSGPLSSCASGMHLNLASGHWRFRRGTLRWKCRLTSSEASVWTWADAIHAIYMCTTCLRQHGTTTTTMFHRWGGMRWILSTFFPSPYLSLTILVQDGRQRNMISLSFLSLFFFFFLNKLDLVWKHTGGTLATPSVICWRWHRPTYLLDLANCFLASSAISHTSPPPCSNGSFGIAELTSAFLFGVLVGQFR